MIKVSNITSVKFLFGIIYMLATVIGFTLIALILPGQINTTLESFFNGTIVPGIRQEGETLSDNTRHLLVAKKSDSLALADAAFTREKEAIVTGYANIIMPIAESLNTELLNATINKMLAEVNGLKGVQLRTEKNSTASDFGKISKNSNISRSYKKVLESEFTYVELTLFFSTETLLKQIENEEISFNQLLKNIDQSVSAMASNIESETALAQQKISSKTRGNIIFSAILATILFTAMSIFLLHMTIIKRLVSANKILHNIAEGDLTKKIQIGRHDEIGSLFFSMQKMQEKLSHNIQMTSENGNRLFEASVQLLEMSDESSKGIHNQHTQTERVESSIEKMELAVNSVSEKTALASQAAEESLKKSSIGKESAEEVVVTVNELSENIKESEGLIHNLHEESQAIDSILDVITGISEQTNLLALNAAIEAARAGETGRGFAVVADEVRTLANRTQTSANDIRQMVERLSLQTNNAVKSMKKSRSNADRAVEKIHQTGEAIQSLSSSITVMSNINIDISSAAEEQAISSDNIHKNITDISAIGKNNFTIATDVSSQAKELSDIAKTLRSLVAYFTLNSNSQLPAMAEKHK